MAGNDHVIKILTSEDGIPATNKKTKATMSKFVQEGTGVVIIKDATEEQKNKKEYLIFGCLLWKFTKI